MKYVVKWVIVTQEEIEFQSLSPLSVGKLLGVTERTEEYYAGHAVGPLWSNHISGAIEFDTIKEALDVKYKLEEYNFEGSIAIQPSMKSTIEDLQSL